MKQVTSIRVAALLGLVLSVLTFFVGYEIGVTKKVYNDDYLEYLEKQKTRDYAYEAYCDSIWEVDKDYYLDVLAESDEYMLYLEEHGGWWN